MNSIPSIVLVNGILTEEIEPVTQDADVARYSDISTDDTTSETSLGPILHIHHDRSGSEVGVGSD